MRRRFLVGLLLLSAIVLTPAQGRDPVAPVAPVAAVPDTIQARLDALLVNPLFESSRIGVQVVDLARGDEVWSHEADQALIPASVTKVLTTAVALRNLGSAWTFETRLLGDGEVDADGVLNGDLYVKGGGDPTLVVEQVWKIVRDLQSAGVTEIDGDVVFDDSAFEAPGVIPGWNKAVDEANGPSYFAPLGGLSVNYNTACILVAPGAERGAPARLDLETAAEVLTIENEAVTGSAGSRPWMKVERELRDDGGVTFKIAGNVPLGAEPSRIYRTVGDPTAHFMAVFKEILADRGIKVRGRLHTGRTPSSATVLVRHRSEALGSLLARMNKQSNNLMAEQVLRAVGARSTGGVGTTAAGVEEVARYLESLGARREEFNLVNGSGLSRDVLLRPSHITAVLFDLWNDRRVAPEFVASLAVAGVDGTLRRRLDGGDVGLVRGKTGSLNSVYCLAGYVHAGDGQAYAFAFLANGFSGSTSRVRALQDAVIDALLAIPVELPPAGAAEPEDEGEGTE